MSDFPLFCLLGPTASGKSALALELATRWPIEILTLDSAQVFRGMDVGTAKPTLAEQAQVPHHLLDLVDPEESYSAARWALDCKALLPEIRARGRIPVVVGGTLLYLRALAEGLSDIPPIDPARRAEVLERAAREGWPAMHAWLAQLDPTLAARLAPRDRQRIQRGLEVVLSTGVPLSVWQGRPPSAPAQAVMLVSLEPKNRQWLHDRIAQRFHVMVSGGLIEEVDRLRARGTLTPDMPSVRCVGYRQAWAWRDGELNESDWIDAGIAATRQLAKRQLTGLRGLAQRQVIVCDDAPAAQRQVLDCFERSLS